MKKDFFQRFFKSFFQRFSQKNVKRSFKTCSFVKFETSNNLFHVVSILTWGGRPVGSDSEKDSVASIRIDLKLSGSELGKS